MRKEREGRGRRGRGEEGREEGGRRGEGRIHKWLTAMILSSHLALQTVESKTSTMPVRGPSGEYTFKALPSSSVCESSPWKQAKHIEQVIPGSAAMVTLPAFVTCSYTVAPLNGNT